MSKCKNNCAHAIFCPSFGEYKCEVKQKRIYGGTDICRDYEKNTSKEEKKCHCLSCMAEGYVNDDD